MREREEAVENEHVGRELFARRPLAIVATVTDAK
jgi:hypothetical protein